MCYACDYEEKGTRNNQIKMKWNGHRLVIYYCDSHNSIFGTKFESLDIDLLCNHMLATHIENVISFEGCFSS